MKLELFPFQKIALARLRQNVAVALNNYQSTHTPQVVSYTAPTGAGKTIVMSALIEDIYFGNESYPDQRNAIFVWLSDSPQLNEQSKLKIDLKADKIALHQCVTISDDSFDEEVLEDGHIYFLNTQKLSKSSNLTKHSDGRQYTIWETLANTVNEKSDRLYFIIDEAHRGAQKPTDLAKNTTIMQKFLKGSEADKLPPMPIVIGMTATSERFIRLATGLQSTTHYVKTTPDEVRQSGLLKDRIVITYPKTSGNDMAVLQAATDEWKNKWDHWHQYCFEQHYAYVNPILVVQVQNGSQNVLSYTNLNDCLRVIEERLGDRFLEGQVVHAFGEGTPTLTINGLKVPYCEPSRIADDKRIKVVFFKETLSTGWDCPRAETMMSFRHASDYTYVAQLLGRMVRTPMQMHINVDETLNDVHLYLPQFNADTVYQVVSALQSEEGATIPADIEEEVLGNNTFETWGLTPTYNRPASSRAYVRPSDPNQIGIADIQNGVFDNNSNTNDDVRTAGNFEDGIPVPNQEQTFIQTPIEILNEDDQPEQVQNESILDRQAIAKAINDSGLLTYNVRHIQISSYLKSMYALARFFMQTRIAPAARNTIFDSIVEYIHKHIEKLKQNNLYDDLQKQVLQFKLDAQVFDVYGRSLTNETPNDLLMLTDTDVDRQFRNAEAKLGNEGIANHYLNAFRANENIVELKIHVIIFANDSNCMAELEKYAKTTYHNLNDAHRRETVKLPDKFKMQYDRIVSDGDIVSKHNFKLPETITPLREDSGKAYADHLFVDDNGVAIIKLNSWEERVIAEEETGSDFICWIRNPSRGSWAMCIPYESDNIKKPMYPDFLIVRNVNSEYVVDILEPHDPTRVDNLGKAKGFAAYAKENPGVGRIQLIRMKQDSLGNERPYRLDMSKSSVRDKVMRCINNDELNHIFETDGFFMN